MVFLLAPNFNLSESVINHTINVHRNQQVLKQTGSCDTVVISCIKGHNLDKCFGSLFTSIVPSVDLFPSALPNTIKFLLKVEPRIVLNRTIYNSSTENIKDHL